MVEMKSGKVVLSLAAQLVSWRAVLVFVRTWATCKPWQRKDFHQYSIFLADCLKQSKQTVCESTGAGAAATESRKVGKGRRKRRYADEDEPGANPELELGPRGPTLRKQVLKGFDCLALRLGLQPAADSVDISQDFEWESKTAARYKDSSSYYPPREQEGPSFEPISEPPNRKVPKRKVPEADSDDDFLQELDLVLDFEAIQESDLDFEAMDPAGSPSSIRKVADTAHPSSSSPSPAAAVPGWRSFFCLGNGK